MAEMAEQPRVISSLAARREEIVADVRRLVPTTPAGTVFAARGSSANASIYGRHAIGLATRRPALLESLSVRAAHGVDVDYSGWLAIGTSQSGRTPEIVDALDGHRSSGATTIAITNASASPLGAVADLAIDLGADFERAVPATKSLTAQLAVFALLSTALDRGTDEHGWTDRTWQHLVDAITSCLDDPSPVDAVRREIEGAAGLIVCGRGFAYPVAREGALKIKEVTGIPAEAYSNLDLLHGPIAVTRDSVPTLVVALRGPTEPDIDRLVEELVARSVPFWTVGDRADADIAIPAGLPEPLAAIAAVVRLQQLALGLALGRGIDPDAPHQLSKVTLT